MATCSCRLRTEDYETFRSLCGVHGMTVHEAMRIMVGKLLVSWGESASEGLKEAVARRK